MHVLKQGANGPHRSHEKQFQSMNTFAKSYDYMYIDNYWYFKKNCDIFSCIFENWMASPWIPYIQGCFVPNKIGIGPVVLDKKIFKKNCPCISLFRYKLPWKRTVHSIRSNLNPNFSRIMLFTKFCWNWPSVSGEINFQILSMNFSLFPYDLPFKKRVCPSVWTNLNPLYPRRLCANWNWLRVSREEDFWITSIYFCYFIIISPWKRTGP